MAPVHLRIFKDESTLEVWEAPAAGFEFVAAFGVLAWSGGLGPKLAEGDLQAPEGFYDVALDRLRPSSKYHLGFDLGFPNRYDAAHARTGSFLMVHGGHRSTGCYAIGDEAVEQVYGMVEGALNIGDPVTVHCFPFRLTARRLAAHARHRWYPFWRDELAPVFRVFEETRTLPVVDGGTGRYRIIAA